MFKAPNSKPGFTIVELLIVVVVIAILAAISVVAYSNVAERANTSAAKSAAQQATAKILAHHTINGMYPDTLAAAGITDGGTKHQYSRNNAASPATFCVTATSGNVSYFASNNATTPQPGGCPGHGVGGVAAITNMAINPRAVAGGAGVFYASDSIWVVTRGVTVPATPDGITTAAESRLATGALSSYVLSVYNLDGLLNSTGGIARSISVWVRVNAAGYDARGVYITPVALTPNVWTRVQTNTPVPGDTHSNVYVRKTNAEPAAESDRAWVTGTMAVQGNQHYSFADGGSPNWVWNGTPNNSTSTGPAQ